MTKEKVIGKNNKLPWHIPTEFAHFKKATLGKPLIMGKRSFESLRQMGLPGRDLIVMSNTLATGGGYKVARNRDEALALADNASEVMIGGGTKIYEEFLPIADQMILSTIRHNYDGDTFFPEFNSGNWKVVREDIYDLFTIQYFERIHADT
jgi:dihydrofolate reductase